MRLEIGRNKVWLKNNKDEKSKDEFKKRITQLEAEIIKYKNINLKDYKIPPKKEMEAWFEGKCTENAILYFDGLSRSGPWYHITGISGNNYNAIKPKTKYHMVFYLVFPREYAWMESFYIYLDQFKP